MSEEDDLIPIPDEEDEMVPIPDEDDPAEAPEPVAQSAQVAEVRPPAPISTSPRDLFRQKVAASLAEDANVATAAVRGVSDYASAGFADEGVGLLESLAPRLALPPSQFFDPDVPTPPARSYAEARDTQRLVQNASKEEHPVAYHGAGIASGLLLPTGIAAGTGWQGAAKAGAILGAASGVGNSEADLTTGDPLAYAETGVNAAASGMLGWGLGAGMYAGASKLGELVGPAAARFSDWLTERVAPIQAMRGMGGTGADFTYLSSKEGDEVIRQHGRRLLDEDVVPFFEGKQATFEKVQPALRQAGADMGADLRTADATRAPFDMEAFLQRVEQEVIQPNAKSPAIAHEVDAIRALLAKFRADYPDGITDFVNANRLKSDLASVENWANHWNNAGPSLNLEKYAKQTVGIFNDEIEGQMERAAGRVTRETFEDAKERYAALKWAERITGRGIGKEIGNGPVSMKDMQAGQMAASIAGDNPSLGGLVAAGGVAAYNFARKHGGGALAIGADRLGQSEALYNLARTNPQALGEYAAGFAEAAAKGVDAVGIRDWMLQQTDPNWTPKRGGLFGSERQ